jgi:hypothetical protein
MESREGARKTTCALPDPPAGGQGGLGRGRWYRLLLVTPFVWQIGLAPWAGHVGYAPGRVPFLLVWMAAGVVVGSASIGATYLLDRRTGGLERA